ncbi:conserved oligomeric Golgi complex subunit 7-like, partial [Trifolium medium]|nr:conserved oligomeric Golgi complex subunit 7-like [Trifolium medium]
MLFPLHLKELQHLKTQLMNLYMMSSYLNAYPQSYVTSVGEYLLTLPQQLEPLAEGISSSEANDEAQFFATEWMFK